MAGRGLCTFSELLYYERYYPELVDWWWYYRVNYYEPIGWIDLPVYDYTGFIAYRNAVYLRGAQFLYELRAALGQEQFFEITKAYVQNQTGKSPAQQNLSTLLAWKGESRRSCWPSIFNRINQMID